MTDAPKFTTTTVIDMGQTDPKSSDNMLARIWCNGVEVGRVWGTESGHDTKPRAYAIAVDDAIQPLLDEWMPEWIEDQRKRRVREWDETHRAASERDRKRRDAALRAVWYQRA